MVDLKEDLWLYTLIAGILGIITIFTPAVGITEGSNYVYIWIWNLYATNDIIDFIQTDEPLYNIGVATTIIISIGTIILLLTGLLDKLKNKKLDLFKIIGGLLLLIGPIVYMAGITAEEETFWEYYNVNVGSILPFFAGSIAILAGVMGILRK